MGDEMKNICFICYDLSIMGGAEKVATDVANALSATYNVHVVSLFGGDPILPLCDSITHANLNLDLSRLRKGIIPAIFALRAYYKKQSIDLSFIIGNYAGMVCSPASLFTGTKQVFCDHGALMNQWDKKDIRTIRRISSMLCNYTITLTEKSRMDYIDKFHLSPKKVYYMHNWIESMPTDPSYKGKSSLIISAGRFGLEKGFHSVLPQVARQVFDRHPNWQWHIFGDGEYVQQAMEKIHALGLDDFLILKGRTRELERLYKDYGIYVMTSDREGMPLVLLEAKANGLPICAFDVQTGPNEIVRDGVDGCLVAPMDVQKMAGAICTLIENPSLRKEYSDNALKDVDRFSKEKLLSRWIGFIEQA